MDKNWYWYNIDENGNDLDPQMTDDVPLQPQYSQPQYSQPQYSQPSYPQRRSPHPVSSQSGSSPRYPPRDVGKPKRYQNTKKGKKGQVVVRDRDGWETVENKKNLRGGR